MLIIVVGTVKVDLAQCLHPHILPLFSWLLRLKPFWSLPTATRRALPTLSLRLESLRLFLTTDFEPAIGTCWASGSASSPRGTYYPGQRDVPVSTEGAYYWLSVPGFGLQGFTISFQFWFSSPRLSSSS